MTYDRRRQELGTGNWKVGTINGGPPHLRFAGQASLIPARHFSS